MKVSVRYSISEIISALLLTIIVLSAIGILCIFMSNYFTERKSVLYLIYSSNAEKLKERIAIVYVHYNDTGLYLCIYNYGYVNAEIGSLYINNTLINKELITPLSLPVNKLTIVYVNVQLSEGVYYIKIISSRGNTYATFIKI